MIHMSKNNLHIRERDIFLLNKEHNQFLKFFTQQQQKEQKVIQSI